MTLVGQHLSNPRCYARVRTGIFANCSFPFPKIFCAEVLAANSADPGARPTLTREVMLWEIMRLLPKMLNQPEFRSLSDYLSDPSDVRKRFQLCSQIANLFDQYLVFRPDLILAWDQSQLGCAALDDNIHELWQAALWRRLRQEKPGQHLAAMWKEFAERVAKPDFKPSNIPARL